MLQVDLQGHELSGAGSEARDRYCEALRGFNLYRGDPVNLLEQAIATSPDFAMARILKAYLFALATEPDLTRAARAMVNDLRLTPMSKREGSHVAILDRIVAGRWTEAAHLLDRHNADYPRDLAGVQVGHLVDFYRANARSLRDRIARVLPAWTPGDDGYATVLGFYSFGLEESGDYARAEDVGREAVEREPLDCWAHHAVAHVMEMQGRAKEGLAWMTSREPEWSGDDNFFKVHNWWHRALFHMDLGENDMALALYDGPIHRGDDSTALELIDASALLWRLHLTGTDVRNRWRNIAAAWDRFADGGSYPFNDWHAVMAYLGADRQKDVDRILARLQTRPRVSESDEWARTIGFGLASGFVAFWRGDYSESVRRLAEWRHIANTFGGSHAQRDIIDWTLTEAAVRGGDRSLAVALANERLAVKPHSPINASFVRRARALGQPSRSAA